MRSYSIFSKIYKNFICTYLTIYDILSLSQDNFHISDSRSAFGNNRRIANYSQFYTTTDRTKGEYYLKSSKSDDVLNEYWGNSRRFADLFNGIVFEGQQILQPESLSAMMRVDKSLLKYYNDYKINLVSVRQERKRLHSSFILCQG